MSLPRLAANSVNHGVNRGFTSLVGAALVFLISFNLSWVLILIRIYSRLDVIKNLNKTILNLDFFLIIVNLCVFALFFGYVTTTRNMGAILGKRIQF